LEFQLRKLPQNSDDRLDDVPKQMEDQIECPLEPIHQGDHLSFVGASLTEIPKELGIKYGNKVRQLDLSYNSITTIKELENFTELKSLVLDNNSLNSAQKIAPNSKMQTLWVNNNNITDLKEFLDSISRAFPNLTYLSMLKNPACPNYFTGKDFDDYKRYRYYVLYRLRKLKFLDSSPVTEVEKKESLRVGPYMITAKPDQAQYTTPREISQDPFPTLPNDLQPEGKGSAKFGVSSYVYYGKHSEGNRFIVNEDL